jgi:hypothetical protein
MAALDERLEPKMRVMLGKLARVAVVETTFCHAVSGNMVVEGPRVKCYGSSTMGVESRPN